jgi:hypothetical protein
MTARHPSEPFAPTARREGPPGIDWTQAAPECAACWRAWVGGDLPTNALLSPRMHAALAAATLAVSSAAPTAVLAAAGHPHQRGHTGLRESDPGDAGVNLPVGDSPPAAGTPEPDPPDADPEGPDQGTSPAPGPVADQSGPNDPVDRGADPEPSPNGNEAPAPPITETPPPEGTVPVPSPPPPSASTVGPPVMGAVGSLRTSRHVVIRAASPSSHRSSTHRPTRKALPPTSRATTRTVALRVASAVPSVRVRPGDRSHVVRQGESLWSIAKDALGGHASSARVAAEVDRLWELNRATIGTGDADVLPVGTRLTLR